MHKKGQDEERKKVKKVKKRKLYKIGKKERSEADIPHSFITKIIGSTTEEELDSAILDWIESPEMLDIQYIVDSSKYKVKELQNTITYLSSYDLVDMHIYDNIMLTAQMLTYKLDELLEKAISDDNDGKKIE